MEKKEYIKPEIKIITLQEKSNLLQSSELEGEVGIDLTKVEQYKV